MARKFILAAVAVIVVSAVTASTAAAQDCGASCSTCGLGGYEGRSHASDGAYNMSCFSMVPYCVACPKVEMAAAHAPDAGEIANAVRTATRATIATVVSLHHARLLVVPERNLIVIKGSACDPTALRSVVRVGAATVMAFAAKGVPSLTDYLEPAAP